MGYYKQHSSHKRKRNWILLTIIGIIVGSVITSQIIPSLTKESHHQTNQAQSQQNNLHGADQLMNTSVQVDVSTQVTDVVREVTPAVVGVTNLMQNISYWHQSEVTEAGTGSGVIYKIENGNAYVVTNHHVIEGADEVEVVMYNETAIPAEIVGSDIFTDLAVLQMDASKVEKVIDIGSSGNIKVGEPAIAIGNPLGHMFSSTVTQGVISGTERTIPQDFDQDGRADWQAEVIQTDAAINPGNSGGALINIYGQLIGINSMKINQEAVEGIAFSIPIDYALPVIQELERTGEVVRPYLGVEIYSIDEIPESEWEHTLKLPNEVEGGVYVWTVETMSPADRAGLKQFDVITAIDGKPTMSMIDLRKILYHEKEIGEDVVLTFYRNGERMETTFELGSQ